MLDYRNFPLTRAVYYWFTAPTFAYLILTITLLTQRSKFGALDQLGVLDEFFMLGIGAGAGGLILVLSGSLLDYRRYTGALMLIATLVPVLLGMIGSITGYPSSFTPSLEWAVALSAFCGLCLLSLTWCMQVNETTVVRYRGRIVGVFLTVVLGFLMLYRVLPSLGIPPKILGAPVIESIALGSLLASLVFRPWRWQRHALAVSGRVNRYFRSMVLLLAAHMLWYFATELKISSRAEELGEVFISLGEASGLTFYEPVMIAAGVCVAAGLADIKGRKASFSLAVLFVGLLSIFGSTFYGPAFPEPNYTALLITERFIEGFLLGLCAFLIWGELGSPKTRGRRLAAIWSFFIGYVALFWAVSLHAFGWGVPSVVVGYGNEFAILLSLLALYTAANTEELLGRELEMEGLNLDFDEREVKKTVDAYVGADDFASIRTQLDVMDATEELSDSEITEILGEELKAMPLRSIHGVGARMEERLMAAGYESPAQLAGETPTRLSSKLEGMGTKQAERIIAAARESVKEIMNAKDKGNKKKQ